MEDQNKIERKLRQQKFLLTFFDPVDDYKELEVNGYWLIKHWNGVQKAWRVSIFTQETFKNYKSCGQQTSLLTRAGEAEVSEYKKD